MLVKSQAQAGDGVKSVSSEVDWAAADCVRGCSEKEWGQSLEYNVNCYSQVDGLL